MLHITANLFYGVFLFFFPNLLWDVSGSSEPLGLVWIRWAVAPLIVGLGLLYPLLFENYTIHTCFIVVPCVVAFAVFVVMIWARQGAQEILK